MGSQQEEEAVGICSLLPPQTWLRTASDVRKPMVPGPASLSPPHRNFYSLVDNKEMRRDSCHWFYSQLRYLLCCFILLATDTQVNGEHLAKSVVAWLTRERRLRN